MTDQALQELKGVYNLHHMRSVVYFRRGISLCFIFVLIYLAIAAIYRPRVLAHPGNTAADGCHYCWTNCYGWGEIYGERHCHGGYYYDPGPSLTEQGEINGEDHATSKNRAYIESSAANEGTSDGSYDGSNGDTFGYLSNADVFCSEEVTFTTPQSEEYVSAFQQSYTEACIPIYEDSYSVSYDSANGAALESYYADQEAEYEAEKSEYDNAENSNNGWYYAIGIGTLTLAGIAWDKYKK